MSSREEREPGAQRDPEIRRRYRKLREAQIQELAARLELWEARARKAGDEARDRFGKEAEELRRRLEEARVQLSLLRKESEDAWDEVREGLEEALADVREAFENATSRFGGTK